VKRELHAQAASATILSAERRLAAAGIDSSRLDAQLLLAAAAGVTREDIVTDSIELSESVRDKFSGLMARRERREPIAYILGHKEFYSLDFEVTPAVLIPRPETELVVGAALESIAEIPDARVLDIGTGSGAIAIAIAVNAPQARVTAVDISVDALAIAARNVRRHRVDDRVTLRRADCFAVLDEGAELGSYDVIVSNPPYLDEAEIAALEPEVRRFEPRVALTAGAVGLDVLRRIANGASEHLASDGELIVEMGAGQAGDVVNVIVQAGLVVASVINDFAGFTRVARAARSDRRLW
jgi:release factor glutamine methyltransferase